jgi:quinol monooxygenase YgiN
MIRHRWLIAVFTVVALGVLSVGSLAWAQDQRQYVVVYVEFKPAQVQRGERVLQELAAVARKSPGFVNFTVLDEIERANRFTLFELWASTQAFEDFTNSPRTQVLLQVLQPLLAAPLDQRPGNLIR